MMEVLFDQDIHINALVIERNILINNKIIFFQNVQWLFIDDVEQKLEIIVDIKEIHFNFMKNGEKM